MSNFNYMDLVKAERDRRVSQQRKKTNEALADQKAEFEAKKKKRTKRKIERANTVMGAVGTFAESIAAGLEAEGLRRAKFGESGIGMARAFSAGASEVIDFGKLQKARRKSAMIQDLGFTPSDEKVDADLIELLDALTTALGKQNQTVAPRPMTTNDDDDPVPAAGAKNPAAGATAPAAGPKDPLAQPEPQSQENPMEVLQSVAGIFGISPQQLMDTHPVLKDMMQPITGGVTSATNARAREMGLMEESPGVFVDSTGQVVDVGGDHPLDTDGDGMVSRKEANAAVKKGNP